MDAIEIAVGSDRVPAQVGKIVDTGENLHFFKGL